MGFNSGFKGLISQDCKIDTPRSQNVPVGKLCSLAHKILNLSERVLQPKKKNIFGMLN